MGYGRLGVAGSYRKHVEYDVGCGSSQLRREISNRYAGFGAVNVSNSAGKLSLVLAAMIDCDFMPKTVKGDNYMRPDEVGAPDNHDSHLTRSAPLISPASAEYQRSHSEMLQ
jgi:hypothetical protein